MRVINFRITFVVIIITKTNAHKRAFKRATSLTHSFYAGMHWWRVAGTSSRTCDWTVRICCCISMSCILPPFVRQTTANIAALSSISLTVGSRVQARSKRGGHCTGQWGHALPTKCFGPSKSLVPACILSYWSISWVVAEIVVVQLLTTKLRLTQCSKAKRAVNELHQN